MASYEKAKVIHMHCKLCSYVRTYVDDGGTKTPKRCPRCHVVYDEIKFLSIPNDEATPMTHNMVRWACQHCRHHGVMWLSKKNSRVHACPNCDHERGSGLRVRKIDPKGNCSTIWEPVAGITRPKIRVNLPKKKLRCGNCHQTHYYLLKKPTECHRCGEALEGGQNDQAQSANT
jgi:hypothetical protein